MKPNPVKRKKRAHIYAALLARARFAGVPEAKIPLNGQGNLKEFRRRVEMYEQAIYEGEPIHHTHGTSTGRTASPVWWPSIQNLPIRKQP